ncbi:hypothetical protein CDD83_9238 [Cordyceps sp. RAO-2017]|nr:hypothetical protein CDD83_9238 [Cordyceps sp. RAO-2017]
MAARGLEPFYLTATLGSTDVCAVDDLDGIAAALAPRAATPRDVWVHVDAAYAGAALVLDEHRPLADAAGRFRSFNFNPHKWLFTTFDCSALFVRRRDDLIEALSVQPPYLRNAASDAGAVVDFRDWQIALGRRFRSLKLWAVLRAFGARALRDHVRLGIRLAEALEARLRARSDLFAVFTPARFALVTLRLRADADDRPGRRTQRLHRDLDARGDFFLTATVVDGRFAIRVCTAGAAVRDEHVQSLFEQLVERAEAVLAAPDDDDAAP